LRWLGLYLLTSIVLVSPGAVPAASRPPAPRHLVVTAAKSSLTLRWSPARPGVALRRYIVYRDGVRIGSTARRRFTFTGLRCSRRYRLGVAAVDRAGHRSRRVSVRAATACGRRARYRFAYSNRRDQALMRRYGYNLIDVSTKSEADATPPGTHALVWLYDYDNSSCSWEVDDATTRAKVESMKTDPKVVGFYFANESDPYACPNAIADHRARNAMIKSLAPSKFTLIAVDMNWREKALDQMRLWKGAADYLDFNPYVCYRGKPCDYAWLDTVIHHADASGQPYFLALQAFGDEEWRWPTAAEERHMLERLARSRATGYMSFSWNWNDDPLIDHPGVLREIQRYNLGR
jgi:hypothetical protein